jgi:hypothetical protein
MLIETLVAPATVHLGEAVGIQIAPDTYPELYSYQALKFKTLDDYIHNPSPRYWLLWPGVLMMLTYSFADLFVNMLPTLIRKFSSFLSSSTLITIPSS